MILNSYISGLFRRTSFLPQAGSCILLLISIADVACVSPRLKVAAAPLSPQVAQSATRFRKEYLFAEGDQIEVIVRRVPEASRAVMVRSDGYISLPMVNDVKAAGLTTTELRTNLTALYSERLVQPEVSVIPTQVRQPVIYVSGDVTTPAAVPFREAPTAMQAIALAGGFRRTAASRDVAIIRLVEDGHIEAISVTVPTDGQPAPYVALRGILLQPDDIVFVPENGRSQMSRFLDDFINRPLQGVNSLVQTYVNFRLVTVLNRE